MLDDLTTQWQHLAACRGEDSAYFYAPNYFEKRAEKNAREAVAKALCVRCPVREICLEYALEVRGDARDLGRPERDGTPGGPARPGASGRLTAMRASARGRMPRMNDADVTARLSELGIELPPPPKAVAAYVPVGSPAPRRTSPGRCRCRTAR